MAIGSRPPRSVTRMPSQPTDNSQRKTDLCRHPGEALMDIVDWSSMGGHFVLTERELAVAKHIFRGKTRHETARDLVFAPGTLRVYIDRLFDKLGVTDRLGLALRIMQAHLRGCHQ